MQELRYIYFFGIRVTDITREELNEYLIQSFYEKKIFRVVFLNEKKMFNCLFNKEFRNLLLNTELVICSSVTVAWVIKFLTKKQINTIMPVTVFLDFMRASEEMNFSVYLFGGNSKIANETYKRIKKSFPKVRIVGYYRSHLKQKELEKVLITIRKSSPNIFFASLGNGWKQEKWLTQKKEFISNSIILGLDNSFKIIAGKKKMPPIWFQEKNLNGLYYSLLEPYNIFRFFRIIVIIIATFIRKLKKKI